MRPSFAAHGGAGSAPHPGRMAVLAYERLAKAVGASRATQVTREALASLGDRDFDRPQDLLDLAGCFIKTGGLIQIVGHSLKVQALLRGAVDC